MRVCRSLLYVPGNRPDLIAKIERFEADVYLLDLEDGVPAEHKDAARQTLLEVAPAHLRAGRTLHVRVNAPHTPWHRDDVATALSLGIGALHVPKVRTAEDLLGVDHWAMELSLRWGIHADEIRLFPSIENSRAVLDADAIARASTRVAGLVLGADDLTAEWGAERTTSGHEIEHVRQQIVLVAAAHGILPIDATYPFHRDHEGAERDARRARALGFRAKQAIHPGQCAGINRAFTPTAAEVERARGILAAAEQAAKHGHGTAGAHGTQIDQAVERGARRLLDWAVELGAAGG